MTYNASLFYRALKDMTEQLGEEIQKQSVDLGCATSRQRDVFLFITLEELSNLTAQHFLPGCMPSPLPFP